MNKAFAYDIKLDNSLRFRLNDKIFFNTVINNREKMSKTPNNYMTTLDYEGYTEFACFLRCHQWCLSLLIYYCHCTPLVIANPSTSLLFLIHNGMVKIYLKTVRKKNKHKKIALLARNKFNRTEK